MRPTIFLTLLAGLSHHLVNADSEACSNSVYQTLLPLSSFAPAKRYCSVHYPSPEVTVTVTVSAHVGRAAPTISTTAPTTSTITTEAGSVASNIIATLSSVGTTSSINLQSQWWMLSSKGDNILSTFCSCVQTPATTTVTLKASKPLTPTVTKLVPTTVMKTTTTTITTTIARTVPTTIHKTTTMTSFSILTFVSMVTVTSCVPTTALATSSGVVSVTQTIDTATSTKVVLSLGKTA